MKRPVHSLPVPAGGTAFRSPPEARAPDVGDGFIRLGPDAAPRRGLRGGPETLLAARRAYLAAQYSGCDDRRPEPGLLRRDRL